VEDEGKRKDTAGKELLMGKVAAKGGGTNLTAAPDARGGTEPMVILEIQIKATP
jgi:hypothetical protein